ncbi:hypothetical protein WA026_018141 [Henosepilachna vigintioctopunctata]|uniref:Protein downstream neighbor of son homolog n=1 Tax=Henosepilachna vigintioctopunctata TaxID=420089 RepID=A0AAW1UN49_9CUCU
MPESPLKDTLKWQHPAEVLKLQKLRLKKRNLQSRIKGISHTSECETSSKTNSFENVLSKQKRKNPFSIEDNNKRKKFNSPSCNLEESGDQTLFKLLHTDVSVKNVQSNITSFDNILSKLDNNSDVVEVVKALGEHWLPIDWALKTKIRLLSLKPFPWNQKLKLSEEASGVTGFARCLGSSSVTYLDASPNAKFHQCCLYWQQPSLPWVKLFPRSTSKSVGNSVSIANNPQIRDSLQKAWFDSLRSLFQLIRTKQCPYFYVCANNFTVLFRAAGISGYSEVHALVSPTTRGFRKLLKSEDIEFQMPLKKKRMSDQGYDTMDTTYSESTQDMTEQQNLDDEDDEDNDDLWLKSMGINQDDIKQIKYTQQKIVHKAECEVDNSEQSLVLIEGTEVHSFYNFLLNCKSIVALTGPLAGIPPTLLAPVAFNGATLNGLKVRENKVKVDDVDYFTLELLGPILPTTIHSLFSIHPPEYSLTATFQNLTSTIPFSKTHNPEEENRTKGEIIFVKENLSDCGLNEKVLEYFCTVDSKCIVNVECIKYDSDNKTFTWT